MENRPHGRQRKEGGKSTGVFRRGEGLGGGPVGEGHGPSSGSEKRGMPGAHHEPGKPAGGDNAPEGGPSRAGGLGGLGGINLNNSGSHQNSGLGGLNLNNGGQQGGGFTGGGGTSNNGRKKGCGIGTIIAIVVLVVVCVLVLKSCGKLFSGGTSGTYSGPVDSGTFSDSNVMGNSAFSQNVDVSDYLSGDYGYGYDYGNYSDYLSQAFGGGNTASSSTSALAPNVGYLDTNVVPGAREKYQKLKGNGQDTVTLMVYMCGTDLESQSGMATSDLSEMAQATKSNFSKNVNVLVLTGGCSRWKNNVVSNKKNQIYRVAEGGLDRLVDDFGSDAMTNPDNLSNYIQWCKKNYPADRYGLILWDHGGGSVSGYGYDEKKVSAGSMTLDKISSALKRGGVTFDFIGFDACLMATYETAVMLGDYADYMIASEESEPGIGWYYTNWLSKLGENPSTGTLELGKQIADDFVSTCRTQCYGQSTTLSVVDLAELTYTAPSLLKIWATSTKAAITGNDYQKVSKARNNAREFAQSERLDQIDLVDFLYNLDTEEATNLASAVVSAVKYNNVSTDMTGSYGLSIYFPYRNLNYLDYVSSTYANIGMDSEYLSCIKDFATMESHGQYASGGQSSSYSSLFGSLSGYDSSSFGGFDSSAYGGSGNGYGSFEDYGYGGYGQSAGSYDLGDLESLLGMFLGGNYRAVKGLNADNTKFLEEADLDTETAAAYIKAHSFDPNQLVWNDADTDEPSIHLSEDQWALISRVDKNTFYDDGTGYIDLGYDNVFSFSEADDLIADNSGYWLSINDHPVAYYHQKAVDTGDHWSDSGYVPCYVNGKKAQLLLVWDDSNEDGYIAGYRYVYDAGETLTVAKSMLELSVGDVIDFTCDYYAYDGTYQDSYYLGEALTVTEDMVLADVDLGRENCLVTYRFTDIYDQDYWTPQL